MAARRSARPALFLAAWAGVALPAHGGTGTDLCPSLGVLAGSAALMRERGVPEESGAAIMDMRAREHGVSEARRARIRAAVALGYRSTTPEQAEATAVARCRDGVL